MNNLTTHCSDCVNNHTINCNDERKNSWYCPSYKKKMSPHEKHIMRIAEELTKENCEFCKRYPCEELQKQACIHHHYNWMMSLKENKNE